MGMSKTQKQVDAAQSGLLNDIDKYVGIYRWDLTEEQRQRLAEAVAQDAMDQILRGLEA